jgi:hypothetical protein
MNAFIQSELGNGVSNPQVITLFVIL